MKYSRKIFTLLFITMVFNFANGQAGVRAGVNMASLKIKIGFFGAAVTESSDNTFGGHIGVFYRAKITEKLSIRPNLLFTTGGGKVDDPTTGELVTVNASYLQVPVDLMYSIPVGKNSLSVLGGPFIGYLLSSSSSEGSSEEDEFTSTDYGINMGLHFQIKAIGIGFTYGLGLSNVVPEEVDTSGFFGNVSANSRIFSLYFTYNF